MPKIASVSGAHEKVSHFPNICPPKLHTDLRFCLQDMEHLSRTCAKLSISNSELFKNRLIFIKAFHREIPELQALFVAGFQTNEKRLNISFEEQLGTRKMS